MTTEAVMRADEVQASLLGERGRPRPVAPYPPRQRLGLLAALRALRSNPLAIFAEEAFQEPFVEYRALGGTLLVSDPHAIEKILLRNASEFVKSDQTRRVLTPGLGNGLVTAEGKTWLATRRIVAPFFGPRALSSHLDRVHDCCQSMVRRWHSAQPHGAPLDISREMLRLSYETISGALFSGAFDDDRERVQANMARIFDAFGLLDIAAIFGLPAWVPTINRLRALPASLSSRRVVDRILGERMNSLDAEISDLLGALIRSGDRTLIYDNIRTFIAVGHDTTGYGLTWTLYLLALHPDIESRVLDELSLVLNDAPPSAHDLDRLVVTRAVVNESLRLYPPAPIFGRQPVKEVEICGRRVKRGTPIVVSPWVVHRHRELWDEPDFFNPGRFLPPAVDNIRRGAFIPFGLGPRRCIGMHFAMQTMLAVLATILPRFRLRLAEPNSVRPEMCLSLRPAGGLPAYVTSRQ